VLALAADPARSLVDALAEAIQQVASLHPGCDLQHPGTPSATMVLLRARDEGADYLALADAVLLLDTADGLQVVSDERVNQLAGKEREAANRVPAGSALKLRRRAQLTRALRRARNRPGGYWVAAADPTAASQAVAGSLPSKTLRRAVLLSDGAAGWSTRSGWLPGRRCWRCWTRAAPRSCCARSAPPRPSTPRVGNGPGPSAATTPPPSTSPLTDGKAASGTVSRSGKQ
jgi:hypothetical protein